VCVFVAVKSVTTLRHVGELSGLVISLIRQPSSKIELQEPVMSAIMW
jgi:hypothetical protein